MLKFLDPLFGDAHAVEPFELERLGHHADGQDPLFPGRPGDHRCGPGAGAAAHAGGDEHHVGLLNLLDDVLDSFFGGCPSHLGSRAHPKPLGDITSQLNLAFR